MSQLSEDLHWIGFDLGGTKMFSTVYDQNFKLCGKHRTKTKGHEGYKVGLKRMVNTIRQSVEDAEIDHGKLAGIGVGCPGPLDLDQGILKSAPNLGWENVPIKETLESEFKCDVHVINDVDAGVYGEYRFGAGKNCRTAVGVFPGTGIGGGCVYDGKILRGTSTSCMEIGHMQVLPNGPLCGCGQRGCLEAVASRLVIASQAATAAFRGKAPILMENHGTDISRIRSGAIKESIHSGDNVIDQIVRDAARYIGVAVANVIQLLAPDIIILGGGLVEALPDMLVKEVKKTAKERVLPSFKDSFEVKAAELGDLAGVLGAAAWAEMNGEFTGAEAPE